MSFLMGGMGMGGPPMAMGPGGISDIFERNQEATIYVGNLDPKIDEEVQTKATFSLEVRSFGSLWCNVDQWRIFIFLETRSPTLIRGAREKVH